MKDMKFVKIITAFVIVISACNLPSIQDVPLTGEYAIPLINAEVTVGNLLENSENFGVSVAADGTLTLEYKAELLSESISEILPTISSIGEVPILDTVSSFSLSEAANFIITKAIFKGDEIRFRYAHDQEEKVNIHMLVPELTKDGVPFEFDFELDAQGNLPYTEFTPSFPLSGYQFESEENQLTFNYDARDSDGERIKLTFAAMSFNLLDFSYAEGSFERTVYALKGDSLAVNVLNGWSKGTLEFSDPTINFNISHTYGFPIAIQINDVAVSTTAEEKLLTSSNLGEEIVLDYPTLTELGKVVTTQISFDKENSNINTLFNETVRFVDFDIDAIINPEDDLSIKGYATDESFFNIEAEMELPLNMRLADLTLLDTIDIEKLLPDFIAEAEFKVITKNSYPLKMSVYFVFLDENNGVLERFLENDPLIIEPAQEKTKFINLESSVIENLSSTRKMVVVSEFNTESTSNDFVHLLADQALELRVGLKFKQ